MKRSSDWIVTPAGLSVALTVLVLSGAVTSAGYFWWQGEGVRNALVGSAGMMAVLATAAVFAALVRAAWQRTLDRRWWPVVVPAYATGLLLGLILAPFAVLDIEAGVFLALLAGPVVLIVLGWIALWTTLTLARARIRARARAHRIIEPDPRSIAVTVSRG